MNWIEVDDREWQNILDNTLKSYRLACYLQATFKSTLSWWCLIRVTFMGVFSIMFHLLISSSSNQFYNNLYKPISRTLYNISKLCFMSGIHVEVRLKQHRNNIAFFYWWYRVIVYELNCMKAYFWNFIMMRCRVS